MSRAITIELDTQDVEILDRLRGSMSDSNFFRLLLQIADSGAVSATPGEFLSPLPPISRVRHPEFELPEAE